VQADISFMSALNHCLLVCATSKFVFYVVENKTFKGSMLGISIGTVTQAGTVTATQKIWRSLQALGAMAFAYSFSIILIEIQVTRI